ncbi:MAG: glycosyltransferase [Flavobacteriales bacterium]|nr:glycosyltransferase [Flavobacteriales bacterium]
MRIAFVHDWLVVSGGAEKVTREILQCYDADVFALVDFLDNNDRAFILQGKKAKTTFIQQLPFARHHFRNYLPLFPAAIERLDLSNYDLILSASYAVAKGVRTRPDQVHVCYVHTPMRYAWVNEAGYLKDHGLVRGPRSFLVRKTLEYLREWDLKSNASIDRFIANSANVAKRVKDIYHRDPDVLLPPVDTDLFTLGTGPRTHYIAANRMVPYKSVDRIIEAFRHCPKRNLIICGDGPERAKWEANAPDNVRFLGHLDQAEFIGLLQNAKALITAADEDLGLTPLEAQACGTPSIALRKGGYLETITEGVNGLFFDIDDPADIVEAMGRFEAHGVTLGPADLRAGMMDYSSQNFRERFKQLVLATLQAKYAR